MSRLQHFLLHFHLHNRQQTTKTNTTAATATAAMATTAIDSGHPAVLPATATASSNPQSGQTTKAKAKAKAKTNSVVAKAAISPNLHSGHATRDRDAASSFDPRPPKAAPATHVGHGHTSI